MVRQIPYPWRSSGDPGTMQFYVKECESDVGRNPKTGKNVPIEPKKIPFFKSEKELKVRVNR